MVRLPTAINGLPMLVVSWSDWVGNVMLPLDGVRRQYCKVRRTSRRFEVFVRGDPVFAGLSAFTQRQAFFHASRLSDMAGAALRDEVQDPLLATLGAYALLRTDIDNKRAQWVENLAKGFPWLPDGAILLARLLERQGNRQGARALYLEGALRGPPLCTDGLSMLLEGLRGVAVDEEVTTGQASDNVKTVLDGWNARRLDVQWDALFTSAVRRLEGEDDASGVGIHAAVALLAPQSQQAGHTTEG